MYKLFRLNVDLYAIVEVSTGFLVEKNQDGIIAGMLLLGLNSREILAGLLALEKDDMAEYGINKTFIFSKKLTEIA